MQATRAKIEERHRSFRKGVDPDEARRKRDEHKVEIRKSKREETLMKKRREQMAPGAEASTRSTMTEQSHSTPSAQAMDAAAAVAAGAPPSSVGPGGLPLAARPRHEIIAAMPALRDQLYAPNATVETLLAATREFRKILSIERAPPIQEVIECEGAVEKFVEFLALDAYPELQFEAAWALTNIASGSSMQTTVVVQAGALPQFVRLLHSPSDDVCEQAAWALGNIAGDSTQYRDMVLQHGAMEPLLTQLRSRSKLSMLRNATWTLSNFCRGKPTPDFRLVHQALPVLATLVHSTDDEVLVDACWALSYLSDDKTDTNVQTEAIIRAGMVPRLAELLRHPSAAVQQPALRTLGNIVTGTDEQTQAVLDAGVLPYLLALLSSLKRMIRKETCWMISNITAGTQEQISMVIEANLIPPLVHLMSTSDFDTRKEATWAVSNATAGGTDAHIAVLVQHGCIKPLCDMLMVSDAKVVQVALEGLENILAAGERQRHLGRLSMVNEYARLVEEADGLDKLEALQNHVNEEIYNKSVHLIETYFGAEDEDEIQGVAPMAAGGGDGFGFGIRDHGGGGRGDGAPPPPPPPGSGGASPFGGDGGGWRHRP
ncbi:hypothetical protein CDCA_CDCA12G3449 [Cyanidium caldarium]|uniref:IBB domain-containing protein n=1 Tax=Cyanidium caldarium TaxID=2771 RepID=A0AAV9IZC7_CYACA|nr:hypothetical protein CDCA_CDCA12G3449 [Cyanidium caldarium]